MENDFNKVYEKIKEKYYKKYNPKKSAITSKKLIYILFTWLIFSFIQGVLLNFGFTENILYLIIQMISTISILLLVILIFMILNKNVEYWKYASNFKKEVGREFWNMVDNKIIYNSNRDDINREDVKVKLFNLYDNSEIIDVEDMLQYGNIEMYTVKFNDENKKRLTGTFVVINECFKESPDLENMAKGLNLSISSEIIKICKKNELVYFLLDAKEVFNFNNLDFLNVKELEEDYIRLKEIEQLRNIL